jgi:hypothetical protein
LNGCSQQADDGQFGPLVEFEQIVASAQKKRKKMRVQRHYGAILIVDAAEAR